MIRYKEIGMKDHDKVAKNIDLVTLSGGYQRQKEFQGCLFVYDNSFSFYFNDTKCYHWPNGFENERVYKTRKDGYWLKDWLIKMSYYDYE